MSSYLSERHTSTSAVRLPRTIPIASTSDATATAGLGAAVRLSKWSQLQFSLIVCITCTRVARLKACFICANTGCSNYRARNCMSARRNSLALRMRLALGLELGAGMAVVDPLLEGGGRLEHHHPTRRDRNLGTGLRIAPNPLALL